MANTPKYTTKTCYKCGARRSQPLMVRNQIYEESGKSKSTISDSTWIGVMLGDKASARAVQRAGFNSGQRTYFRKKTVWQCKNCNSDQFVLTPSQRSKPLPPSTSTQVDTSKKTEKTSEWFVWVFWGFVILCVLKILELTFS